MIISMKYLIRLADSVTLRPIEKAKLYLKEARVFGSRKAGGYYVFTDFPTEADFAEISATGYWSVGKKIIAAERESVIFLQRLNGIEAAPLTVTVTDNAEEGDTELYVFGERLGGTVLSGCHIRRGDAETVIGELCGDNLLRLKKPLGLPLRAGQTLEITAPVEEIV